MSGLFGVRASLFLIGAGTLFTLSACQQPTRPKIPPQKPPAGQAKKVDQKLVPAPSRTFSSADHRYMLTVSSNDSWRTRTATAVLTLSNREVWRQTLPHSFGPRIAIVLNSGQVVLFDEFVNVASDYAVAIYDNKGGIAHRWSYQGLLGIFGVESSVMTKHSTIGPWLSDEPRVFFETKTNATIRISAGAKHLDLKISPSSAFLEVHI